MTQHALIIEYIKLKGSIVPACLNDHDRQLRGDWIGSEAGKRCRELRKKGVLVGLKEGRFERFYLKEEAPQTENVASFLRDYPSRQKEVIKEPQLSLNI